MGIDWCHEIKHLVMDHIPDFPVFRGFPVHFFLHFLLDLLSLPLLFKVLAGETDVDSIFLFDALDVFHHSLCVSCLLGLQEVFQEALVEFKIVVDLRVG
jgi:hypothetical protein